MYFGKHTQQEDVRTELVATIEGVNALAEHFGWEECEWELREFHGGFNWATEFQCQYRFHYGEEYYTCELTANKPDHYCTLHGGE